MQTSDRAYMFMIVIMKCTITTFGDSSQALILHFRQIKYNLSFKRSPRPTIYFDRCLKRISWKCDQLVIGSRKKGKSLRSEGLGTLFVMCWYLRTSKVKRKAPLGLASVEI